jgi:hypothetical protein
MYNILSVLLDLTVPGHFRSSIIQWNRSLRISLLDLPFKIKNCYTFTVEQLVELEGPRVGRAIPQAVIRRLPTAAARAQTRVWSCGIL